ncbi:MAG: hypothetical protein L3J88_00410 [Gammaproteobacteria bacterium]|nr:hypothetical protein [Gammaproteobacteria bacterium]MCF6361834.1 hypothetical protein [Gammaproteobacteria bacterium]
MVARHLTLLVPALRPQADCGILPERLPALETLLGRADRSDTGRRGLEASLFSLFDVIADADHDLPIASVTYTADTGRPPEGACLRADPVHLMPDRDQLVLLDSASLDLREAEVQRLIAELNAVYAEDGWRFEAPSVDRWYLRLPEMPHLRTQPLADVTGQPIGRQLPSGEQGKVWHGIMNEIQMLLHTSSVNLQREADGHLTVSSLWFWGGGAAPSSVSRRWTQVWSRDPVAVGLGMLAGVAHGPLPETAQQWLSQAEQAGEHLLVLRHLDTALKQQGGEAWWVALQDFEQQWVVPLLTALRSKQIDSLQLDDGAGTVYQLTRRSLRRWWRRRVPLAQSARS